MRHLGIVSDAHHYKDAHGQICTLTPLARQFEQWAMLFDRITIVAPLLPGPPPSAFGPYAVKNIFLVPLPLAGGNTLRTKLHLLKVQPKWWVGIRQLLRNVDAVHIRCPNNVGIPGLLAVARTSLPRQATFTGTWTGYSGEPLTYRWQRWYLSRWFAGPVTVYGAWPNQPPHVVPSFSPSFSDADWESDQEFVDRKIDRLRGLSALPSPIQIVTVGSLNKNQNVVIHMVKELLDHGLEANLDVLGGGPQKAILKALVDHLGLRERVQLHGHVSHALVRQYLRTADFVVQAPRVEGFGKVPIEAFFHGTVPILSNVNLSAQLVGQGERGRLFIPDDHADAAKAVTELNRRPTEMAAMLARGRIYARGLTLERWREHLRQVLEQYWNVSLQSHSRHP